MVGLETQLRPFYGMPSLSLDSPGLGSGWFQFVSGAIANLKGKTEIRNLLPYATSSQRPHLLRDFSPAPGLLDQVFHAVGDFRATK